MAFLWYRHKTSLLLINSYNNSAEFLGTKVCKLWSHMRSLKEKLFKTWIKFKVFHWKLFYISLLGQLYDQCDGLSRLSKGSESPKRHASRWILDGIPWKDLLREKDLPQSEEPSNRVPDVSSEGKALSLLPLLLGRKSFNYYWCFVVFLFWHWNPACGFQMVLPSSSSSGTL